MYHKTQLLRLEPSFYVGPTGGPNVTQRNAPLGHHSDVLGGNDQRNSFPRQNNNSAQGIDRQYLTHQSLLNDAQSYAPLDQHSNDLIRNDQRNNTRDRRRNDNNPVSRYPRDTRRATDLAPRNDTYRRQNNDSVLGTDQQGMRTNTSEPNHDRVHRNSAHNQGGDREICQDHIWRRCGVRSCPLYHYKLCWAFLWDGHGPEGCSKSDDECDYKHPHICSNSWNHRYCPNLRNCPYRHLKRTTETPRNAQRARFTEDSNTTRFHDYLAEEPPATQRYTQDNAQMNSRRSYASVARNIPNRSRNTPWNPQRYVSSDSRTRDNYGNTMSQPSAEQNGSNSTYTSPSAELNQGNVSNNNFLSKEQFQEFQEASRLELSELKQALIRIQETLTQAQRAPPIATYQVPQQSFPRPINILY